MTGVVCISLLCCEERRVKTQVEDLVSGKLWSPALALSEVHSTLNVYSTEWTFNVEWTSTKDELADPFTRGEPMPEIGTSLRKVESIHARFARKTGPGCVSAREEEHDSLCEEEVSERAHMPRRQTVSFYV